MTMKHGRSILRAAVTACVCAVVVVSGRTIPLRAQNTSAPRAAAPAPWTGEPGITESVADIMARDAVLAAAGRAEPTVRGRDRRHDRSPNLRQNPGAPSVRSWPLVDPLSTELGGTPATAGPSLPQTVGTSFLGVKASESGFIPPDSVGAAGPTQFLVATNGRIKVFDKAGNLGPLDAAIDTFFLSVRGSSLTSDPRVVYDRLSGRFFISMITVDAPNRILFAVSSGSTISGPGSFTFFQFQHDLVGTTPNPDTGGLADYDSLGVDANAAYVGINEFNAAGTSFLGSSGYVIRKSSLLAGGPIVVTAFRQLATSTGPGPFAPRGVTNDDPAATEGYFIGVDNASFGLLQILRVSDPGGTPTISGNLTVAVPATFLPRPVQALGSIGPLDALDDRLFDARIKNGSLWTAHNINVTSAGVATSATGVTGRDGSRFYEITNLTTVPTLHQSGTLFDSTTVSSGTARHHWIPSIAASGQGHVAMGTSLAAPTNSAGTQIQPSVAVAGRLAGDPLGTIQAPTLAQAGGGNYNVQAGLQRWGDYSATMVDPNDDMTFWTVQEYADADNSWGVRVVQLMAPPPARPSSTSPSTVSLGATGVNVVVTGTSVSGSGFFDPGPAFPNRIAATVNGGGVTVNSVTFTSPTSITLNVDVAPGAAGGARTITVINPDGQSATSATGILTVQTIPPTLTLKVNGQHPSSGMVTTSGPMLLTLDLTSTNFAAPVSWYWGLIIGNQLFFITSTGLQTTAAPLIVAPPMVVSNATLFNITLAPGTTITTFFALVESDGTVLASDVITAMRP
jgi:hypothetical protein